MELAIAGKSVIKYVKSLGVTSANLKKLPSVVLLLTHVSLMNTLLWNIVEPTL